MIKKNDINILTRLIPPYIMCHSLVYKKYTNKEQSRNNISTKNNPNIVLLDDIIIPESFNDNYILKKAYGTINEYKKFFAQSEKYNSTKAVFENNLTILEKGQGQFKINNKLKIISLVPIFYVDINKKCFTWSWNNSIFSKFTVFNTKIASFNNKIKKIISKIPYLNFDYIQNFDFNNDKAGHIIDDLIMISKMVLNGKGFVKILMSPSNKKDSSRCEYLMIV